MTRTQRSASAKPTAERTAERAGAAAFASGDVVLIAGLGNPGPSYSGHRHNVGFMALDAIARAESFPAWRSKFQGEVSEGRIGGKRADQGPRPEHVIGLGGRDCSAAQVDGDHLGPRELAPPEPDLATRFCSRLPGRAAPAPGAPVPARTAPMRVASFGC